MVSQSFPNHLPVGVRSEDSKETLMTVLDCIYSTHIPYALFSPPKQPSKTGVHALIGEAVFCTGIEALRL